MSNISTNLNILIMLHIAQKIKILTNAYNSTNWILQKYSLLSSSVSTYLSYHKILARMGLAVCENIINNLNIFILIV